MADLEPSEQMDSTPANGGGLPWGLLMGVSVGVATGFAHGDMAIGAGLAVAFGITFSFLSPLVRETLNKLKSDDAAEDSVSASEKEKDSR